MAHLPTKMSVHNTTILSSNVIVLTSLSHTMDFRWGTPPLLHRASKTGGAERANSTHYEDRQLKRSLSDQTPSTVRGSKKRRRNSVGTDPAASGSTLCKAVHEDTKPTGSNTGTTKVSRCLYENPRVSGKKAGEKPQALRDSPRAILSPQPSTRVCSPSTTPKKPLSQAQNLQTKSNLSNDPLIIPDSHAPTANLGNAPETRKAAALDVPSSVWSNICNFLFFTDTARLSQVCKDFGEPSQRRMEKNPEALPLFVPGDFKTFQAAMTALDLTESLRNAVTSVHLGSGAFLLPETVNIRNIDGLTIRGSRCQHQKGSSSRTFLHGSIAVDSNAKNVRIESISFRPFDKDCCDDATNKLPALPLLTVRGSGGKVVEHAGGPGGSSRLNSPAKLIMEDCTFQRCSSISSMLIGHGASVYMNNCRILDNEGMGLFVFGPKTQLIMQRCVVSGNSNGISIMDGAHASLLDYTRVKHNDEIGITVKGTNSSCRVCRSIVHLNPVMDVTTDNVRKLSVDRDSDVHSVEEYSYGP